MIACGGGKLGDYSSRENLRQRSEMWDEGVAGPVGFGNGIGGWWEWGALAVRIVSFCCIMAGKEWKQ